MEIIVLNADYSYLNTVSVERAFQLIFKEKVEVVAWSDKLIRSINQAFKIPAVVRLKKLIKEIFKRGIIWKSRNIFIRDDYTCQYCGKDHLSGNDCTVDHVIPKSRGGKNTFENTVTCCKACNNYKGDKLLSDCKMMFFKRGWKPYKPSFLEFLQKDANKKKIYERLKKTGVF